MENHLASLEKLSNLLNTIDGSKKNNDFSKLKKLIIQVQKEKEYIKDNYTKEEITVYKKELQFFIKQINEKFDNIVQSNKNKQAELKRELEQLGNKRKLANYHR